MACPNVAFTLNVSPDQRITIGRDGQMHVGEVELTEQGYFAKSLTLPTNAANCMAYSLEIHDLNLSGIDHGGDAQADEIVGQAEGTATFLYGDVGEQVPVELTITGSPDHNPPSLRVPQALLNPLRAPSVVASEPLDLAKTALQLVGPSSTPLIQQNDETDDGGPALSAISWSTVILPLSGEWQVVGSGYDLIGLGLTPSASLKTMKDPGVFAQDGFEGALGASIETGQPRIVTGLGTLAPIAGGHSLWLDAGTALTFHLQRTSTQKTLHFWMRAFGTSPFDIAFGKDIVFGVVGGKQVQRMLAGVDSGAAVGTGDAQFPWASQIVEFSATLDEAGPDVLLSFADWTNCGTPCLNSNLMLDGLTID